MLRPSLLVFSLALAAAPAMAGPARTLMLARVPVGDLDLKSAAGATAMVQRLDGAAREICALPVSVVFPGNSGREWRCRREAVAAAVQRLHTPELTLAFSAWLSADPSVAPPSLRYR